MEGDAGTDADDSLRTQVTDSDSPASEARTEKINIEDSPESEVGTEPSETGVERSASRLSRGWLIGLTAALVLAAGGLGLGGYLALRAHQETQAIGRSNAEALEAAKVCVAATQAPDTRTIAASEQKIIECGTDEYRTQALLYTSMIVQAYQAANAHVQVSDERAAIERTNSDGTVDVLVALRVKVSNTAQQNQEAGYRLRAKMALADGQYRIAKLDTVTTK
jgi:Mce-associated membrane protein